MASNTTVIEKPVRIENKAVYDASILHIIEGLAKCESGNNSHAINPDDGGSRSVGMLQFKDQTFKHYVRRYELLPHVEDEELKNWIWDGKFQKLLAYRMIEEDRNNLNHWKNCSKKLELI